MKAPSPSNVTALAVLVVLLALVAALPHSTATGLIEAGLVALFVTELDRSGRHLALRLVSIASYLLPRARRSDLSAEWRDYVLLAGENGLRPVIAALSVMRGAIRLMFRYRVRTFAALHLMSTFVGASGTFLAVAKALSGNRDEPRTAVAYVAASAAILTLPLYMIRPSARHWPLWLQLASGVFLWLSWHILVVVFVRSVNLRSVFQGALFGLGTAAMMRVDVFYPNVLDPLIRWVGGKAFAHVGCSLGPAD